MVYIAVLFDVFCLLTALAIIYLVKHVISA